MYKLIVLQFSTEKEMFGKRNLHPWVAFCHFKIYFVLDCGTVVIMWGFFPIFELLVCFGFCAIGGFTPHRRHVAELGNESRYLKLSQTSI